MTSNIDEFNISLKKGMKQTIKQAERDIKKVAFSIFSSVVKMSPVDTGRFRGNWQVGIIRPESVSLNIKDPSGGATLAKGFSEIASSTLGDAIFINNNLPYARRLEDGYSGQAPQGMVAITLTNVRTSFEAKKL